MFVPIVLAALALPAIKTKEKIKNIATIDPENFGSFPIGYTTQEIKSH
ncbi:MAG: hypothetical protein HYZ69_01070 [Candidatus Colwellbacteria bacterium]|nr:hypothetical protein [Candidatus Colwellbacteria bacterium]